MNRILVIVLAVFMVFNVVLLVRQGSGGDAVAEGGYHEATANMLLNSLYYQFESEGSHLDESLMLTSEAGVELPLQELFRQTDGPLLIMRYSYIDCTPCVDYQVEYLKQIADSIGHKNVVILATYQSPRDMAIFKRINNITFPVYSIPVGGTGIPAENNGSPYIFITDESLRVNYFHVPLKEIPALTSIFLMQIPRQFRRL